MVSNLVDASNKFFRDLKMMGFIVEKKFRYFKNELKRLDVPIT